MQLSMRSVSPWAAAAAFTCGDRECAERESSRRRRGDRDRDRDRERVGEKACGGTKEKSRAAQAARGDTHGAAGSAA